MAIYTDGHWLVGDTLEELQKFANDAGVYTYADHRRRPHYQITKFELPTVMAHGAKRVSEKQVIKYAQAMAKKRDAWFEKATDEAIMEHVKIYAPYHATGEYAYLGEMVSGEDMWHITTEMFKDLRDGNPVEMYKLPKVLPLHPRQDPPTDEQTLETLNRQIQQGTELIESETDAKKKEAIIARVAELQGFQEEAQYNVNKNQFKAVHAEAKELKATIESMGENSLDEERVELKTQLEKLMEKHAQLAVDIYNYEIKTGKVDANLIDEIQKSLSDDPVQTPPLSESATIIMEEDIRKEVTKAALEFTVDRFLELYPQYTKEDYINFNNSIVGASNNSEPLYKAVYDPAVDGGDKGVSYAPIEVTKGEDDRNTVPEPPQNDPLLPSEDFRMQVPLTSDEMIKPE